MLEKVGTLVPDRGHLGNFCAACHFLSGCRRLQRLLLIYFYSFLFLLCFYWLVVPVGRGRWVSRFRTKQNCPCVWPPPPYYALAHNGVSVMQAPKRTLAFPQKQETRICRALVFLLISCYTAPSLDYFLYFFLVPPRLDTPDQHFICSHETNGFFLQPGILKHKLLVRSIHKSDVFLGF